jgi:FkbM family methyltransferase
MKWLAWIRKRAHPLHSLRKFPSYQKIPRYFDPLVRKRMPQFPRPIYLRLFSHASLILDATTQETSILETFRAVLSAIPGQVGAFWDVGANIGWYTWLCAHIRPTFAIVSFEPDSKNLECLRRTSRSWNLSNHLIVPVAVSERSGRATFYLDEITGATGTLKNDGVTFTAAYYRATPKAVEVDMISLDEFAGDHKPPSLIKIDIEGTELSALRGGSRLIERFRPVLLLETCYQRRDIFNFLERFGYRLYDSDRRSNVNDSTVNLIAFVPDRLPMMDKLLSQLGFPVSTSA